jgi:hypothetical protein
MNKFEESLNTARGMIDAANARVPDLAADDQDRFNAEVVEALKALLSAVSELTP